MIGNFAKIVNGMVRLTALMMQYSHKKFLYDR
jgi:hypothetical protein